VIDVLVRNGTVLDGTGADPRVADIAICEGRIVEVGTLRDTHAHK
jgi:N-acyl-D-aspartate/D-glutamate deacylase